jgi:WD40 repeat protein
VDLRSLALSPDGQIAAGGCAGGLVRLWDLASGQERRTLSTDSTDGSLWLASAAAWQFVLPAKPEFRTHVSAVAFSPDGRLLATANSNGRVKVWDPATGRELRTLCTEHGDTVCLAFAPDGTTLALNRGSVVELWDARRGCLRHTLSGHNDQVLGVAFASDGRLLASAGKDWQVRLWDPDNARPVTTLVGHMNAVNGIAFSPDRRTLASASQDGTVRLWLVATGQELFHLEMNHEALALAFAPDGRTLACGGKYHGNNGTVRLWRTTVAGP